MNAKVLIVKADELHELLGCDVEVMIYDDEIIIDVDHGQFCDVCGDCEEASNDLFSMVEGIKLYKKYREGK